jgi:hypothetical protein
MGRVEVSRLFSALRAGYRAWISGQSAWDPATLIA